jgi:hypothetical protein
MRMSTEDTRAGVEAALMRVLELFGAVCADPDNPTVKEQADRALADLDGMFAGPGPSPGG